MEFEAGGELGADGAGEVYGVGIGRLADAGALDVAGGGGAESTARGAGEVPWEAEEGARHHGCTVVRKGKARVRGVS